jgi:deoxyxylulose-5-phosphate synthase
MWGKYDCPIVFDQQQKISGDGFMYIGPLCGENLDRVIDAMKEVK